MPQEKGTKGPRTLYTKVEYVDPSAVVGFIPRVLLKTGCAQARKELFERDLNTDGLSQTRQETSTGASRTAKGLNKSNFTTKTTKPTSSRKELDGR